MRRQPGRSGERPLPWGKQKKVEDTENLLAPPSPAAKGRASGTAVGLAAPLPAVSDPALTPILEEEVDSDFERLMQEEYDRSAQMLGPTAGDEPGTVQTQQPGAEDTPRVPAAVESEEALAPVESSVPPPAAIPSVLRVQLADNQGGGFAKLSARHHTQQEKWQWDLKPPHKAGRALRSGKLNTKGAALGYWLRLHGEDWLHPTAHAITAP